MCSIGFFEKFQGVWKCGKTLSQEFDIFMHSKLILREVKRNKS